MNKNGPIWGSQSLVVQCSHPLNPRLGKKIVHVLWKSVDTNTIKPEVPQWGGAR